MRKLIYFFCFIFCLACIIGHLSLVHASYILPYPSVMPGNKLYNITKFIDNMKSYWYFGSIAKVKYHLMLADKYLVEAKTLFEYGQYLLADEALKRSDEQFSAIPAYIERGISEGKDMNVIVIEIQSAGAKHTEVLIGLLPVIPVSFTWSAEKQAPVNISIEKNIQEAIQIRKHVSEILPIR